MQLQDQVRGVNASECAQGGHRDQEAHAAPGEGPVIMQDCGPTVPGRFTGSEPGFLCRCETQMLLKLTFLHSKYFRGYFSC